MKKVLVSRSLMALGAVGLAILPSAAQTQSRNQNGRNSGQIRSGNFGNIVTLEGVVTSVDQSNRGTSNRFQVQAGGKKFDVRSDTTFAVRQGQRVVLRGKFEGDNNFNARTVTLATGSGAGSYGRPDAPYNSNPNRPRWNDNRGDNDQNSNDYRSDSDQLVNFPGVVTQVVSRDEIDVRGDNGRTYRVSLNRSASEYQVGNRVRVVGNANGNRVENARLSFQNGGVVGPIYGNGNSNKGTYGGSYGDGEYDNGGYNDGVYGNRPGRNGGARGGRFGDRDGIGRDDDGVFDGDESGRTIDFSARIVTINSNGVNRVAVVRGDNGQQYTIRGKDLKNRRVGERIRVRGTMENNIVVATHIDSAR